MEQRKHKKNKSERQALTARSHIQKEEKKNMPRVSFVLTQPGYDRTMKKGSTARRNLQAVKALRKPIEIKQHQSPTTGLSCVARTNIKTLTEQASIRQRVTPWSDREYTSNFKSNSSELPAPERKAQGPQTRASYFVGTLDWKVEHLNCKMWQLRPAGKYGVAIKPNSRYNRQPRADLIRSPKPGREEKRNIKRKHRHSHAQTQNNDNNKQKQSPENLTSECKRIVFKKQAEWQALSARSHIQTRKLKKQVES